MAILRVMGMDPSLRNWGIAAGTYDTVTGLIRIKTLQVISSKPDANKQVRANSKDLAVAQGLYDGVAPFLPHVQVAFAEVPVGSQSARSMASYGICVGVLGSIRATGSQFMEVSPQEVKLITGLGATATKAQMIEWAMFKQPDAPWPLHKDGSPIAGTAEHMADAVASIYAGVNSNQFKQLAAMLQSGA